MRHQAAKKAEQNRLDAIRQAELQKQAEEAARLAALGGAAAIPGASAVYSMGESVSSWLGAAAPQGSYAGSVLSYLGGAVAPLVGGLASAKQVRRPGYDEAWQRRKALPHERTRSCVDVLG